MDIRNANKEFLAKEERHREIRAELNSIECQLSPENLYCDGMRSHAQASKIAKSLVERRTELDMELVRDHGYGIKFK